MPGTWQDRLAQVIAMMREVSLHTDPAAMVTAYARHVRKIESFDRYVSVSRRDLERPWFRVTRDSLWPAPLDPWKQRDLLPLIDGGLLGEILYANEPRLLVDHEVAADDPGAAYIRGYRTIIAVPHYEGGEALNWVIHLRRAADYDPEQFPELVWLSSLFGRLTRNLVLASQVKAAYEALDAELALVAGLQRALLPPSTPCAPGLSVAGYSQPARRAGGDYFATFELSHGRAGLFIADVSGHSAPATVLMAMVHALAQLCADREDPEVFLRYLDRGLRQCGPRGRATFVTAFYAVFDPADATLRYARAGHPPPRVFRAGGGQVETLDAAGDLPLGILGDTPYTAAVANLAPGDMLVCFTDGVTEALSPAGVELGLAGLDAAVRSAGAGDPAAVIEAVRRALAAHTGGPCAEDDCTLLIARSATPG